MNDMEDRIMTTKETIIKVLERMGYRPEIDDDGDIYFWYQMKAIYVLTNDKDDYVSIMLPQFYDIDEGQEALVMTVCNKLTREMKMIKVFVDQTFKSVTGTCEFFYSSEEIFEQNMARTLEVFGVLRTLFRLKKKELES